MSHGKHKCSQCEKTDATRIRVSARENRWLCDRHAARFNAFQKENKKSKSAQKPEKPNFIKASRLYHQ